MTITLAYPTDIFPGPPKLTLDVPDAWEPVLTTDALVAARDTTAGLFQRNVTLAAERFPAAMSLEQIAAAVTADRDARLTHHQADQPQAVLHPDGQAIQWSSEFTVAVAGEPLVVGQTTLLVAQEATTTVRYVAVATASWLVSEPDNDLVSSVLETIRVLHP